MCIRFIVDQNAIFVVLPKKSGRERDFNFLGWYTAGHGLLFYTGGTYAIENEHQMGTLRTYREAGKASVATEKQMHKAENQLDESDFKIQSDDRHMLVLSLAAGATMLCTRDKSLKDDFLNLNIDGKTRKVYPISSQGMPPGSEEQVEFLARNRCERVTSSNPAGT